MKYEIGDILESSSNTQYFYEVLEVDEANGFITVVDIRKSTGVYGSFSQKVKDGPHLSVVGSVFADEEDDDELTTNEEIAILMLSQTYIERMEMATWLSAIVNNAKEFGIETDAYYFAELLNEMAEEMVDYE